MAPTSTWRVRLLVIPIVFTALFLLLLAGEWAMRWMRPDLNPSRQLQNISDPFIGWRFLPEQKIDGKTEEGGYRHTRINALGFADSNHHLEAVSGTIRIAFLGDSFTAATHVDSEDSFVSVVRRKLQANQPSLRFETFNFGQSGFGTANEYLAWKHYVAPFHPNIVVLAFFLGNDVANNLLNYPTENFQSPKFELVNGTLKAIPYQIGISQEARKRDQKNWFYRSFLTPSLLYQQYKLLERDLRAWLRAGTSQYVSESDARLPFWKRSYAPVDWQTYLRNPEPQFETAWKVTEALLLKLNDEIRASGAQFCVALLPGKEAISPEEFKASYPRYPGIESFDFDLDWPGLRLQSFLEKHQIPVVNLTFAFKDHQKKSGQNLYFKFDRHFNLLGHHIAGEEIAKYLKNRSPQS